MGDQKQETPSKSHPSSTYLGSTHKRTQSPFSRRTWDVNAKVVSPFRRLGDLSKRSPSSSIAVESQGQKRRAHNDTKSDEIMDWLKSMKQRAQSYLQTEEEEEKRFYEQLEKERRQIEAQTEINTESFDKLKLYLDQEAAAAANEHDKPKNSKIPENKSKQITLSDLESFALEQGALDSQEDEEDDIHSSQREEDEAENDYEEGSGVLEEVEEEDLDEVAEESDDVYDDEGRLIFPDDSQLIHLSSDEAEEEEDVAAQYNPEDFSGNAHLEYVVTPQYESMYAKQTYVPDAGSYKSSEQSPSSQQHVVTLLDSDDKNENVEENFEEDAEDGQDIDNEEYSEDLDVEVDYESDEEQEEANSDELDSTHRDQQIVDRDQDYESDTFKDEPHDNGQYAEGSEEAEGLQAELHASVDPDLFGDVEEVNEDDHGSISDQNSETQDNEFDQEQPQFEGNNEGNDMSQFELLASAALNQLSEAAVIQQNEHAEHFAERTALLAHPFVEDLTEQGKDQAFSEGNEGNDDKLPEIEKDHTAKAQVESQGSDTETNEKEFHKSPGETIYEDKDAKEEDVPEVNQRDHSEEPLQEKEVEEEEEYVEEQYYDSDNEPFRSPSHSVFGSLTVDEISVVQDIEDEGEEGSNFKGYVAGDILGEIEKNNENSKESASSNELPFDNSMEERNSEELPDEDLQRDALSDESLGKNETEEQTKNFVSFFDSKPIEQLKESTPVSFSDISTQFVKTLKSSRSSEEPEESHQIPKTGNDLEYEAKQPLEDNVVTPKEDKNLTLLNKAKESADSMMDMALGEGPESFAERTEEANEKLNDVIKTKLHSSPVADEASDMISKSLGETGENFVDELEQAALSLNTSTKANSGAADDEVFAKDIAEIGEEFVTTMNDKFNVAKEEISNSGDTFEVTKHADDMITESLGENTEEFVEDIEKVAHTLHDAVHAKTLNENEIFAENISEVATEFVTDANDFAKEHIDDIFSRNRSQQPESLRPTEERNGEEENLTVYHDSHDRSLINEIGTEVTETAKNIFEAAEDFAHVASEAVEEAVENSAVPPQEAPPKVQDVASQEDEHKSELEKAKATDNNEAFSTNVNSNINFEIPDVVRNAVFEAIRVAEQIEEQGEDFVEDESKPQLNRALFNQEQRKPKLDESPEAHSAERASDKESTRVLDIKSSDSEPSSKKRKFDDAEEQPAGIFSRVKRFARFIGKELDETLDIPVTNDADTTVDTVDGKEFKAPDEGHKTGNLEKVVETTKNFAAFVDDKLEEEVDSSVDKPAQVEIGEHDVQENATGEEVQQTIHEFSEMVEQMVEEVIDNPVEDKEIEDSQAEQGEHHTKTSDLKEETSFVEKLKDTAESIGEVFEHEVEEAVECSALGPEEPSKDESTTTSRAPESIEVTTSTLGGQIQAPELEGQEEHVNDEESILDRTIRAVEEVAEFADQKLEEALDVPVSDSKVSEPEAQGEETIETESQTPKGKNIVDEVVEDVEEFVSFVEEKVEETINTPVSKETEDTDRKVEEQLPDIAEPHVFFEEQGTNIEVKDNDASKDGYNDQADTDTHHDASTPGDHSKETDNSESLSNNTDLRYEKTQNTEHISPFKRAFNYIFRGSRAQDRKKDETEKVTKKVTVEEPQSPVGRPSKRRKKAPKSPKSPKSSDFHDHIIMRTRSGKIIGANSEKDIAEAEKMENEEEAMIDRIANGDLESGRVLHDLAVEHEKIEEHDLKHEQDVSTVEETQEQNKEEIEVPVEPKVDTAAEDDVEQIAQEPELKKPKRASTRKGRGTKRSRSDADTEVVTNEELQAEDKQDEKQDKSSRSKSRSRRKAEPPAKSERKLRSRTK